MSEPMHLSSRVSAHYISVSSSANIYMSKYLQLLQKLQIFGKIANIWKSCKRESWSNRAFYSFWLKQPCVRAEVPRATRIYVLP